MVTLYITAGLLTVAGVVLTVRDVWSHVRTANDLLHPNLTGKDRWRHDANSAVGRVDDIDLRQMQSALLDVLRSGRLLVAAALLLVGAVVASAADVLTVLHHG